MEIYKWFKRVLLAICSVMLLALFITFLVNIITTLKYFDTTVDSKAFLIVFLVASFVIFLLSIFFFRKHDEVSAKAFVILGSIIFAFNTIVFIIGMVDYANASVDYKPSIVMPILIEVFSALTFAGYIGAAVMTKLIEKEENKA